MRGVCLTSARSRWQAASQGLTRFARHVRGRDKCISDSRARRRRKRSKFAGRRGRGKSCAGRSRVGQTLTVVESYGDGSVSPATSRPFR